MEGVQIINHALNSGSASPTLHRFSLCLLGGLFCLKILNLLLLDHLVNIFAHFAEILSLELVRIHPLQSEIKGVLLILNFFGEGSDLFCLLVGLLGHFPVVLDALFDQ